MLTRRKCWILFIKTFVQVLLMVGGYGKLLRQTFTGWVEVTSILTSWFVHWKGRISILMNTVINTAVRSFRTNFRLTETRVTKSRRNGCLVESVVMKNFKRTEKARIICGAPSVNPPPYVYDPASQNRLDVNKTVQKVYEPKYLKIFPFVSSWL